MLVVGIILALLGIMTKTDFAPIHQDRKLVIGTRQQDPFTGDYLMYLNVMLPLSEDAHVSGKIAVISGKTRFRIVSYFGFAPPLPHGRWVSNTFFPNAKDREYEEIASDFTLSKLHLLKRDYVCEFRVGDEQTLQGFEVRFTATAERKVSRLKHSEGLKEFGQLLVVVGISLLAVGLSALIRA